MAKLSRFAFGPHGFAASLIWENRKTIGKIVVTVIALLLLPVVLLMMIPSALFGDDSAVETVLFEDVDSISSQCFEACADVDRIMEEAHLQVYDEINADFAEYDFGDIMTVSDAEFSCDSLRIICEFSALTDFGETLNRDKLNQMLTSHMDELFSFEKTEEECSYTQTIVDEDGVESEVVVAFTQVDYTVVYVGNDYITDNIFGLTAEQKELSADFAESLRLFTGGEADGA